MSTKIWLVEDFDGCNKAFATKELALREIVANLQKRYKDNPDNEQELQDYRELLTQYFDPKRTSFYVDDFAWTHEVDLISE